MSLEIKMVERQLDDILSSPEKTAEFAEFVQGRLKVCRGTGDTKSIEVYSKILKLLDI